MNHMSERSSRVLTLASRLLAASLVLFGFALWFDARPVGYQGSVDCGNVFTAGADEYTAEHLCTMHEGLGFMVGLGAVLIGLLVVAGDAWRRSRRRRRVPAQPPGRPADVPA